MDTLLNEVNSKLKDLIDNTDIGNENDVKRTKNYLSALLSHIDAINRERIFELTDKQDQILKRGNVVWVDFGFNIGNEFGGMHPAVILKNFDNDLFVVPISSKKPPEYIKIEQDLKDKKITKDECQKRKEAITEIIELSKINGFRNMLRWARITRMKKISMLRVNFSGTIGTLDGIDMDAIAEKISTESGNKKTQYEAKIGV